MVKSENFGDFYPYFGVEYRSPGRFLILNSYLFGNFGLISILERGCLYVVGQSVGCLSHRFLIYDHIHIATDIILNSGFCGGGD